MQSDPGALVEKNHLPQHHDLHLQNGHDKHKHFIIQHNFLQTPLMVSIQLSASASHMHTGEEMLTSVNPQNNLLINVVTLTPSGDPLRMTGYDKMRRGRAWTQ